MLIKIVKKLIIAFDVDGVSGLKLLTYCTMVGEG